MGQRRPKREEFASFKYALREISETFGYIFAALRAKERRGKAALPLFRRSDKFSAFFAGRFIITRLAAFS